MKAGVQMAEILQHELQKITDQILQYIQQVQYGSVTIVIQDGKVVQIEKNEKMRLR